jgi:hypothetical protein
MARANPGIPKPTAKGPAAKKATKLKPKPSAGLLAEKLPVKVIPLSTREPKPAPQPPDAPQLGSISGVPSESQITGGVGVLSAQDLGLFAQVQELLAQHLGSHAAARVWLISNNTGFETTALDAIRKGQVKVVLATLESQWGPSPSYA